MSEKTKMAPANEHPSHDEVAAWLRDDRFGWRGRIGTINPSTSVTFDHEWPRMLPRGVSFHVTRLMLERATTESLDQMANQAPAAAKLLQSSRVDVLGYGCTIGSLYRGRKGEDALAARLRKHASVPVVTMARSAADAMTWLGFRTIAVANPYTPEINRHVRAYLEESGFVVRAIVAEPIAESWKITELTPTEVLALAKRTIVEAGKIDGLFLSCGNMRTVDVIGEIERETGLTTVSSNQAMLWAALREINVREAVNGFGRLLAQER